MEALRQFFSDIWGLLQSLRQTVGVTDVLDILIVTYLIYRILSFMRKTNASSVIKGVVTILLVAWVANFFTLTMMTYLMRQLIDQKIVFLILKIPERYVQIDSYIEEERSFERARIAVDILHIQAFVSRVFPCGFQKGLT